MREKMLEIARVLDELERKACDIGWSQTNEIVRASYLTEARVLRRIAAVLHSVLNPQEQPMETPETYPGPTSAGLAAAGMPRYKSHKIVHALKIATIQDMEVDDTDDTIVWLYFSEPGFAPIFVTRRWVREKRAEPGGYYVVYEDGYASFSPAKAFEAGYTRIDTPPDYAKLKVKIPAPKPTKGRIVHYTFPFAEEVSSGLDPNGQTRTVPAIIVEVWSDTCVNLRVFQDGIGSPLWKTSVSLKDKTTEAHGNYWEWPPR